MTLAYLLNSAWMLSCRSSVQKLEEGTRDVAATQQQVLLKMLASNRTSAYGQALRFGSLRDTDDFRASVPISNYQAFEPWIDRIAGGEQNVLTTEPVRLLEPTSGSSGGRKLIPYTDSLRRQFRNGIDAWIGDVFSRNSAVRRGRAYWSVTPAITPQQTLGGIKIGFDEDTDYLGFAGRLAARRVLAVPSWKMHNVPVEDTLRQTMHHLLAAPDLTLISVWSPTFLLSLLQVMQDEVEWLSNQFTRQGTPQILRSGRMIGEKVAALWPNLSLISCWCDGPSSRSAAELQRLLPAINIQPKGLLSTEAFVSVPFAGCDASVLSVRSHFFEFQPIDHETDRTYLSHELSPGRQYRVVVTTAGGLYRYRTGDVVSIVGFHNECPLVRFVGREGCVSDLVGEKLTDAFVSIAINNTMNEFGFNPSFACLVPIREPSPRYRLLLDLNESTVESDDKVARRMENELSKNPYYEHAIRIGQLRPLEVSRSKNPDRSFWHQYESMCLTHQMRRGDIKPVALEIRFDWSDMNERLDG